MDGLNVTHGTTAGIVNALDSKVYHLDGIKNGNYLSFERDEALFGQEQLSISMAFKADAAGKGGGLFRIYTALHIDVTNDGQVVFNLLNNSIGEKGIIKSVGLNLADGGWHTFAVSYDARAGAMVGYADGAEVGRIAVSGPTQVAQSWDPYIGDPFGKGFIGLIDDFTIGTKALTAADASSQYAAFANKVTASYDLFRMDFNQGTLVDASPHALAVTHGTAANIAKGAYYLNGATAAAGGNYIAVTDAPSLFSQTRLNVELDVKTAGVGGSVLRVPGSMQIDVTADGRVVFNLLDNANGEHGVITSGKVGAADGAWHHITLAYDSVAGKMTAFVDGVSVGQLAITGATKAYQAPLTIGTGDTGAFKGYVDNVQFSSAPQAVTMQAETAVPTALRAMVAADNTLLHLGFDNGQLVDQSLHGAVLKTGGSGSMVDGAYLLNGALVKDGGNYIELAKDPVFYSRDQMTVTLDFKSSTVGLGGSLFRIHTAMQIDISDDGRATFSLLGNAKGETGVIKSAALKLTDGDWHRVTLTYDVGAGKMIGYVDGVSVGSIAITGATKAVESWGPMVGSPWAKAFHGYVDNVDIQGTAVPPLTTNVAPTAGTDTMTAAEDTVTTFKASTLLANDHDANSNAMYISDVRVVDGVGTAKVVSGNIVFTPGHDTSGAVRLEYLLDDHHGGHAIGTVNVNVAAVNDAPTVTHASFSALNTLAAGTVVGAVTAHDIEGDALQYSISAGNNGGAFAIDGQGRVIVNNTAALTPGTVNHLTVVATDSHGASSSATVDVAVKSIAQLMTAAASHYAKPILINNATELVNALKVATGGETFLLRPDVDYGVLVKQALATKSMVTITSLDPDHPATITSLDLRSANNITFDHLRFEFHGTPTAYQTDVLVSNSNNIHFTNSVFHGLATDYASTSHAENGVTITDGTNISFENNEVSNYYHSFAATRVNGLLVSGNDFHDMQGDGMHYAQVQNVAIAANRFHDFLGSSQVAVTHNDYIQFQTTGTTASTANVMIRDNVFLSGDFQSQVIFFRDQLGDLGQGEMRFKNVTVQGNVIYNDNYHGITVPSTDGLTIRQNTIIGHPGSDSATSSINVVNSTGVSVYDNISPAYNIATSSTIVRNDHNVVVQDAYEHQPNYVGDMFLNPGQGSGASLTDLYVNPHGVLAAADGDVAGSDLLRIPTAPSQLTAVFTAAASEADGGVAYAFDARYTADAAGKVDPSRATFKWDFGDGAKAEGITANHAYYAPGDYHVVLTVVRADGQTDDAQFRTVIDAPANETIGFDNGTLDFTHLTPTHNWGV